MNELYKRSRVSKLDAADATTLAVLVERCLGRGKAGPFYKQLARTHGGSANANFEIGRFLLDANKPSGLDFLESLAMRAGLTKRELITA